MITVGIDVGYSHTKAVSAEKRVTFASVVGTPEVSGFGLHKRQSIILEYPENVQVGEGAVAQSRFLHRREDRNWIRSDVWKYLFLAGLTEITDDLNPEISVVTGLPVAFWDADKEYIGKQILGRHQVQRAGRDTQEFSVTACTVIPQPFGALFEQALNGDGKITDAKLATGTAGVIDIGGKTTNLLSVEHLSDIVRETTSVSVGAWNAVRGLRSWLANNYGELDLRDHQIINAITTKTVSYFGEQVDITEAVNEILEPLAKQVVAEAHQLWNGGASISRIIVSGGGAHLLGSYVKEAFAHAQTVADPVFANAVGFWRLAQRAANNIS